MTKRIIGLILVGLLLTSPLIGTGCRTKSYTIQLTVEPLTSGESTAMGAEEGRIFGSPFLLEYQGMIATIYDESEREVTTGSVTFATSTPDNVGIVPASGNDRFVMCSVDTNTIRETDIIVTFVPEGGGEPVVKTEAFMVAKTVEIFNGQGIDFDTDTISAGTGSIIFADWECIDYENTVWKVTLSFPEGFKAIPRYPDSFIGEMFVDYDTRPVVGECIPGEYVLPDVALDCLEVMFVVQTGQGEYVKFIIIGSGATFGVGTLKQTIHIAYQSIESL